jgi:hypothetical protein
MGESVQPTEQYRKVLIKIHQTRNVKIGVKVTLQTCIREVTGSNLALVTSYPEYCRGITQTLQININIASFILGCAACKEISFTPRYTQYPIIVPDSLLSYLRPVLLGAGVARWSFSSGKPRTAIQSSPTLLLFNADSYLKTRRAECKGFTRETQWSGFGGRGGRLCTDNAKTVFLVTHTKLYSSINATGTSSLGENSLNVNGFPVNLNAIIRDT